MVAAAKKVNANENLGTGKEKSTERVRLAIVDTIVSLPGIRMPFEALVPALQAEGAMVLVDAAHGIGHVDIDLKSLNPDFLVTSLNKWLFVPRGVSALHVPRRNQALIRTSLPTSHRFRKHAGEPGEASNAYSRYDKLPDGQSLGALAFRSQVCGGEGAIRQYCRSIVRKGAKVALSIFGTEIMDSPNSRIRECYFANVRLPLEMVDDNDSAGRETKKIPLSHGARVIQWFREVGVRESGCYTQLYVYYGVMWWRISGMIYVDEDDFRKAAEMLKGLCERAAKGEYLEIIELWPITYMINKKLVRQVSSPINDLWTFKYWRESDAMKRSRRPTPNLLSGYHNSAFEDDIQLLALERVANGKDLLYPFLAIHFVGEKGNMWNATNQCLGALATSTNLVEQLNIRLLQSGRPQCNLINSTTWGLAMNGAEARLFVCWKQGEMFQIRTVQCIHFRGSSLHTLWHFVENILKWGTDERLEEIRGGLKELANPQSAGDE
ncbi:hypothetical protein NPX13_g9763 [Xylaria arbuscula]|uniref:Aminotransferase class V domain-containing protein n=1 Tax=Xylaria arbuscula TaxID=114810 RepID=A0A9W8N5X2_9PEZI|nr:hypothetical protein NPX13_g9763 [Xylaria arbuscula]